MAYSNPTASTNSLSVRTQMLTDIMDEIVAKETVTNGMSAAPAMVRATQEAGVFEIATADMQALGAYDRSKGYAEGSATLTWESYKLTHERSRKFNLDRIDITETGGLATASYMMSEFIRLKVNPEVDVTRLSGCAQRAIDGEATWSNTVYGSTPTKANIISEIRKGIKTVFQNANSRVGNTIYCDIAYYDALQSSTEVTHTKDVSGASTSINGNIDLIDGNPVVWVPTKYMESAITYYDGITSGQEDGGWAEDATNSKHINFLVVAPGCANGVVSVQSQKYITADMNPDADADMMALRIYHDVIVPKQKICGLYASFQDASSA